MIFSTDWRDHGLAAPDRPLYAIGDIHGRSGALANLLDHLQTLSDPASCEIVFLGDLIDRGPDSLGVVRLAMDSATRFGGRTILPGNHELTFLDAHEDPDGGAASTWYLHGGQACVEQVDPHAELPFHEALEEFRKALPAGFEDILRMGPGHLRRGDFLFVHAGISPHLPLDATLCLPRHHLLDQDQIRRRHWAWIRRPFLYHEGGWGSQDVGCVVHGHSIALKSPVFSAGEISEALDHVRTRRRICLDVNASALCRAAALELRGDRYRIHLAQTSQRDFA